MATNKPAMKQVSTRFPVETHAAFNAKCKTNKTTMAITLRELVRGYIDGKPIGKTKSKSTPTKENANGITIDDESRATIKKAATAHGKTVDEFIVAAALKAAKKGTRPNSAASRIGAAVDKIIHHNVQVKNWFDKIEITQGVLAKRPSDKTPFGCGSNLKMIREYLEANSDRITAHHKKEGIEENHNRNASLARRKAARRAAKK